MLVAGYILTVIVAYLLGSIPTGFLVGKARGLDIRTVGSGNIGATNVFRYFGKAAGAMVLLADALKGWLAVAVAARLLANWFAGPAAGLDRQWFQIAAGLGAVVGHNYTCWLHFRGGKGIATSAGVLLALVPWSLLVIFVIWIVVFALSRFVSLASIAASLALPLAAWLTGESSTMIAITAGLTVLAIYKHRSNIKRLLNGTENRLSFRKASPPEQTPKPTA